MTTVDTTTIDIAGLDAGALDTHSIDMDWSEGWGEEWEYVEAPSCECGTYATWDDDAYVWTCPDASCEHHGRELDPHEHGAEGPMMNYHYPLPSLGDASDEYDAADRIRDLPLCVITWQDGRDETYSLALTGGGMDLSWQICEAFMRLGFLPPARFADLPGMAGVGKSEDDRAVVAACVRSLEESAVRLEWRAESAKREADALRERYLTQEVTPMVDA